MFSRAVSRTYRPRASESTPMRARTARGSAAASMPSTLAVPCEGFTRVAIMRSVVVLPAPLGPSSPVIEPSGAVNETSRTASMGPKCFARSSTLITSLQLRAQRQHEERPRDALQAFAVQALGTRRAHARFDQPRRAAVQAHAVSDLRGDEVERVGPRGGDLLPVPRRRVRDAAARPGENPRCRANLAACV